jgi:hypothetical protein
MRRRSITTILLTLAALTAASAPGARAAGLGGPLRSRTVPGVAAAAPSGSSLAGTLQSAAGLSPSQVTAVGVCPAIAGMARCDAEALFLRSSGGPVRPLIAVRSAAARVRSAGAVSASVPSTAPPQADTPAWLQQAYDLTYLSQTAGGGDTVAVVDAYDDPGAASDLAVFRSQYGLPACTAANGCFTKLNEYGQSAPLPSGNSGWEEEESLDLDAVSALCPHCKIVLVEAASASLSDMDTALQEAVAYGAQQVSNSWSADVSSPIGGTYTFPGVSVIASTGDHGYVPQSAGAGTDAYPAAIPGVTAAGGTSLGAASGGQSARGFAESAWSLASGWGGGSGCDLQESKPVYQLDSGCTGRSYADLSADADPSTGLIVYDSGNGGWLLMGGTSLSAPLIAGYEAVTGVGGGDPSWAYGDSALLNDPTSGSTGTCAASISYICNARVGYDGPTGIGSISGAVAQGGPGIGGPSIGSGYNDTYAAAVGSSGATLDGGVYPNGLDTSYWWQYGTSTSYGQQSAAADAGAGQAPVAFSSSLSGLAPSTTYHYRLVAQNADGTSYGYDYTLTTLAAGASPPVDTVAPAIAGSAGQGQTLSVSTGSWTPAPSSYAYRWARSADGGATWSNIAGATAASYTLQAADVGSEVEVTVTATNSNGSNSATTAPVGPVTSAAPFNTVAPAISGAAHQGALLSVSSTWSPAGTSYAYQWRRSGDGGGTWSNITGAGSASYTLGVGDEGDVIDVVVTATNPYGQASATSPAFGPVHSNPPVNTAAPVLTGTPQRTFTLSATAGSWNGTGNAYAYQWQRSADGGNTWSSIPQANASSYLLAVADEGDLVRALVTATNVDGVVSQPSNATQPIAPDPPANTVAPTVFGTPMRNYALTATAGTWTGPGNTYAFQWQRDFGEGYVNIAGATGATYTLATADEGATVRVVVTAANADGQIQQASAATSAIQSNAPLNQTIPTITGTARRSSVLGAAPGQWLGLGNAYAYQWQSSSDGNTWTTIAGASASTYTPTVADEGSMLRVVVTATNPDGTASASSAETAAVAAAPPVDTTAPVLTGSPQRTQTLTATQGVWSGISNTYAIQWQRSFDGSTWSDIAGATGTTYTLGLADEGALMRVLVTASNADAVISAPSQPTATVQAAPPVNTAVPSIAGSALRGAALTTTVGTWGGLGNTYAYQWQSSSDGGATWTNIAGATSPSYQPAVADEGDELRAQVTATNADASVSAVSTATRSVQAQPPVSTAAPTVSGSATRSFTLVGTLGFWGGLGNVFSYQWQRSPDGSTWSSIPGATTPAYTVAVADEGDQLRLLVTATNGDGTLAVASAATTTVQSAPPLDTVPPSLSGAVMRTSTLQATLGTWTGIGNTYSYQWQTSADGSTWTDIPGATASTYTLGTADENTELRAVVTVANPDGTLSVATPSSGFVPPAPPLDDALPVVSGATQRTGTLSAQIGTWEGVGNVYTYQWQRSFDGGSTWTDILGATSPSYTLGLADEGAVLQIEVTAANPDGTAVADSGPTATVTGAPPANTIAPSISGNAQRASGLTLSQGAWDGLTNSYSYQWQRSPDGGTTWNNIPSAGSTSYLLTVADEGDEIRAIVTATNPDGTASAATDPTAVVAGAPPVNTALPVISGAGTRGSTLTATGGSWSGLQNSFSYQWQRSADGATWTSIAGSTGLTYTVGTGDEGYALRLLVSVTNADGSASVASAPTAVILGQPPAVASVPTIYGSAQRGTTLTSTQGSWTGGGNIYAFQWQRSADGGSTWSAIAGATGPTYVLAVADEGEIVRLLVTAANVDGSTSAASAPTSTVQATPPVASALPTISGQAQRTVLLTSTQGIWTGAGNAYAYQWQRSPDLGQTWTSIAGATGATYALGVADEADEIRLLVTATNADGSASAASLASAPVQTAPPLNTVIPTITGSARLAATLVANTGSWSPAATSFAYDWQRGTAAGGFTDIPGASASTYTLTGADVGDSVRVIVTGTNLDGLAAATSLQTATVMAPPQNTLAPPAPAGTPTQGQTLTAAPGTWSGSGASFAYAWLRCPQGASAITATCTQVAVGSSYTLVSADIGHPIGVTVTASNGGGQTSVDSALTAQVAAQTLANTVPPSITGTPQVAHVLSAATGSWNLPLNTISYGWIRCDADGVTGCASVGTGPHYALTAADAGDTIILQATGVSGSQTAVAQSTALLIASQPLPQPTVLPVIAGTALRDRTLLASTGSWANSPNQFSYQWLRCDSGGANCAAISGATLPTYVAALADEGSTLEVHVTAANATGSGAATSLPTAVVGAVLPVNTQAPQIDMISSIVAQGVTLSIVNYDWQTTPDTTYLSRWLRCDSAGANCVQIAGATQSSYTLLAADVGHTIVGVTIATNADGSASASSAATAVVLPAAPRWLTLPTLSTDPGNVGDVLGITPGSFSGPTVVTDTVQLMACFNICVADGPAGASPYTIAAADVGAILRVREVASDPGGSAVVWSPTFVGPVMSAASASAILASGQLALRNPLGATLALARLSSARFTSALTATAHSAAAAASASARRRGSARTIALWRGHRVSGPLVAWACAAKLPGAGAPTCSKRVKLRARATLRLPAALTGRVRVVVVRGRLGHR